MLCSVRGDTNVYVCYVFNFCGSFALEFILALWVYCLALCFEN